MITRPTSKWLNVKEDVKGTIGVLGNKKDSEDWIATEKRAKVTYDENGKLTTNVRSKHKG